MEEPGPVVPDLIRNPFCSFDTCAKKWTPDQVRGDDPLKNPV